MIRLTTWMAGVNNKAVAFLTPIAGGALADLLWLRWHILAYAGSYDGARSPALTKTQLTALGVYGT